MNLDKWALTDEEKYKVRVMGLLILLGVLYYAYKIFIGCPSDFVMFGEVKAYAYECHSWPFNLMLE